MTTIAAQGFYNYLNLNKITIPGSILNIENGAFFLCKNLSFLTIEEGIQIIGEGAFNGCISLTSLTIPTSTWYLMDYAFSGCGFESVMVKGNILGGPAIEEQAFGSCKNLVSVTLGEGVLGIGRNAFKGCDKLTTIIIPDSVNVIRENAFLDTAWLNNQPDGVIYAGKVAYTYKGIMPENTFLTIKEGTMAIAYEAFMDNLGLVSVFLPDSVIYIGQYAFSYCPNLTTIKIGKNVAEIVSFAFSNCSSLSVIYFGGQDILEWYEIVKGSGNNSLSYATMYFYSETEITGGNHWHYVDGIPTIWQ